MSDKAKVTVRWPNGTGITGWLVNTDNGGQNIVFGKDGQWAVMYVVGEGDEHYPPGPFDGFNGATIEYEEPTEFGTIVHARFIEDDEPTLWTRFGTQWVNGNGMVVLWFQFDQSSIRIIRGGAAQ